ncbi:ABC transporter ATP-binding protein [Proteiniborus sp. MB09-C3]|uniref:ABC transporter ATP-binding protein n=1 Tax=Proteiniborus sp. MB09-C3 TaxID=3050072 RepID=UPI002554FE46|nr:ABC transporter ATP-binding protein [Proteiniborus sp. MB09-C3]WIV11948.1 ABC transporter ATP-binding protein [Proteiniborus sp. MB09-C3]
MILNEDKIENKQKPQFGVGSNVFFMLKLGSGVRKSVISLAIAQVFIFIIHQLLEFFITPSVLSMIESRDSIRNIIMIILAFSAGLLIISGLKAYIDENTLYGRVEVRSEIVRKVQRKFMTTSFPNIENQDFLKLCNKATRSVSNNQEATEAIWSTLVDILKYSILLVVYFIVLTQLPPLITAVTLGTTILSYFAGKRINEWGYRHRDEEAEYAQHMEYVVKKSQDYTYGKDIRIFGMQPWIQDIYESALSLYRGFHNRAEKIYFGADVIDIFLSLMRNGIAYYYLIRLILAQRLSAATFLLYFSAVGAFTAQTHALLTSFNTLHKQSLDMSSVREYLDWTETFEFEKGKELIPDLNMSYSIELRDVSFRYPDADSMTLEHINLTIQPGEKIAVVGLNGAGKTTLIKLICGFYDPTEGQVLLNGVDIREYNRSDYYRMFSAVFQKFSYLAGPVYVNVAQRDQDVDQQKVHQVIERAGLTERLKKLPNGLDTHMGKEVYEDAPELSGGEMQRLMLARALYKDAPIIVLDEPTAALDPLAESEIYQRYNELTQGRTSIYISHRLASTRFCDKILLIENGCVFEEGTHESLLADQGRYAELFQIQSQYYQKEGNGHEEG